ncbi:PREDICTED: F-box only protein 43-like [Dinoponera quadriceps]|uniref:F-box only protein 43-like n=1 Tax=Dinoponera quadriceps TaxID=609295 RepID=A0A6P3YG52_DINQU|nr:PREDICTED: F-box only protein 43-like [Dinoponera quadriceps]
MDDGGSIRGTPHSSGDSNGRSYDSVDSGYLSGLTPHSSYTPMVSTGYKNKLSGAVAKRHRHRQDPWQCNKLHRHRSKLGQLLYVSESEQPESSDSGLELSRANQDLSLLAHSTPSCANDDLALGSSRNWQATVPVTPASAGLHLLSPPPSPAMPTSSYAVASLGEEDVEMKLVVPRENVVATSPKTPIPLIVVSPVRRRINPGTITSVENRQLSELSIADLSAIPEIKPKRLDFSRHGLSELRYATFSCVKKEKVDFLSLLGKESNHWNVVSQILSYLGSQDLCTVSMVSTTWKRICKNDPYANRRRMDYVLRKQNVKENFTIAKKVKPLGEAVQMSPKSRKGSAVRKGCLSNVQNLLHVPLQSRPPNSPPVSPSKVKFHSFVKASRTLAHGEYLLPCPKCSFPSHVDNKKNVGTCTRQGCSIEFCTSCSSKPHIGPCITPQLGTPTKRNKRLIVGSRQSKRNLRRL